MIWKIEKIDETVSPNDFLQQQIAKGWREGCGVVSMFQSIGKGQKGNYWESEKDKNLLISILLEPTFLAPIRQFLLSKAISVAIVKALQLVSTDLKIKWPNDIYYKNEKLAGILIENIISGSKLSYSVIGIGLNVNQIVFEKAPNPTSLQKITNQHYQIDTIKDLLLTSIAQQYNALKAENYAGINALYKSYLFRNDGFHLYRDQLGQFEAKIKHIEDSGRLILLTQDGDQKAYWFKEVEIVF